MNIDERIKQCEKDKELLEKQLEELRREKDNILIVPLHRPSHNFVYEYDNVRYNFSIKRNGTRFWIKTGWSTGGTSISVSPGALVKVKEAIDIMLEKKNG